MEAATSPKKDWKRESNSGQWLTMEVTRQVKVPNVGYKHRSGKDKHKIEWISGALPG